MSVKIKNIIIIVQAALLVIVGVLGLIYFGPKIMNKISSFKGSSQYMSLNESIVDLPITTINGEKVELNDNYKFIIYVSKDCSTCVSHIPLMKRINETYCKDQNVELMLLWINEAPPIEAIEEYNLVDCSYIINDYSMSDSYNTVFLADENNNIVYMAKSEYESIVDRIIELEILDRDKLISNSNLYVQENLAKNYSDKPDLIYFSMPGCPDCADANPIVYSEEITNKVFMTRIELVRGAESHDIKDEYNFFRKIYSIDWYPSFLIINKDNSWNIVRKVELSDMKQAILSIVK
jgi:hypothetical protein